MLDQLHALLSRAAVLLKVCGAIWLMIQAKASSHTVLDYVAPAATAILTHSVNRFASQACIPQQTLHIAGNARCSYCLPTQLQVPCLSAAARLLLL
jgi:hypothetical protein